MPITPWVVEHPHLLALHPRTRWAYITLAAHTEAHGAPDGTIDDATVHRVRGQYIDNLTAAGLLERAGDGRWRVLPPRAQEVDA